MIKQQSQGPIFYVHLKEKINHIDSLRTFLYTGTYSASSDDNLACHVVQEVPVAREKNHNFLCAVQGSSRDVRPSELRACKSASDADNCCAVCPQFGCIQVHPCAGVQHTAVGENGRHVMSDLCAQQIGRSSWPWRKWWRVTPVFTQ